MYGKHFESMYTGSMLGAGFNVFAVWGYAIAHQRKGLVEINPALLAFIFGEEVAQVEKALLYLSNPDPKSRNENEDGRRLIREGTFLYRVVNWEHYERIATEEQRREASRVGMQKLRRKRKLTPVNNSEQALENVSPQTQTQTQTQEEKSSPNTLQSQSLRTAHRSIILTQEEIEKLATNPAYQKIDLVTEAYKFKQWCLSNRKSMSVRRFVNWINRI